MYQLFHMNIKIWEVKLEGIKIIWKRMSLDFCILVPNIKQ